VNAPAVALLTAEQLRELVRDAVAAALERREPAAVGPERLMLRADVAEHFGCSVRTIDSWLRDGAPCTRLGLHGSPRFKASELEAWLRARSEQAPKRTRRAPA
jgi:hypothetical protein